MMDHYPGISSAVQFFGWSEYKKERQVKEMIKNTITTGIRVTGLLAILTGTSLAGWGQSEAFYPGGHMMTGGYMGWMMIIFWGILLFLLIFVIRWILQAGPSRNTPQSETALEILKKRLANGEIDIQEFKEKSKLL